MKKQCPECASKGKDTRKDNLHIYPDGGMYCFSCGYYKKGNITIEKLKAKVALLDKMQPTTNNTQSNNNEPMQYAKLTTKIPSEIRGYLASKGINAEVRPGNFLWEPDRKELIYPVYDESNNLVFTCSRYFGDDKNHPRYINRGSYKDNMLVFGNLDDSVVFVVEDYLSAIRIASLINPTTDKPYASYPMFGSKPIREHFFALSGKFLGAVLILDPDKRAESLAIKREFDHQFEHIDTAYMHKDPKDYTDEDLARTLKFNYGNAQNELFREHYYSRQGQSYQ